MSLDWSPTVEKHLPNVMEKLLNDTFSRQSKSQVLKDYRMDALQSKRYFNPQQNKYTHTSKIIKA